MRQLYFVDPLAPEVFDVYTAALPEGYVLKTTTNNDPATLQRECLDADALLVGFSALPASVMNALSGRLQFIQRIGVGMEKIDLEAARSNGIVVANTAGANAHQVAEHTIMLMLSVLRLLPRVHNNLVSGLWQKVELRPLLSELYEKRVGLVGLGQIGLQVARRLLPFDCEVIAYDPWISEVPPGVRMVELDEIWRTAEVISLHVPLTPETRNLLNAEALALFRPSAVLINTCRGEVVDEAALEAALRSGRIRGAGIDAFTQEPPPPNYPLFTLPNVVVTPHIGGISFENVSRYARHSMSNIQRFFNGEPLPSRDLVVPSVR